MNSSPRARAMADSVAAAAKRLGYSDPAVDRIGAAHALAMARRESELDDDHDPAFLHPGRVALILLRDAAADATERAVLVALLSESRDPDFAVSREQVRTGFGPHVEQLWSEIPAPGVPDLAERLLSLPRDGVLAALAERLDHLRHEHLRHPATRWVEMVAEVEAVWHPIAQRSSALLGRRYGHWLRAFRRRL